MDEAALRLAAHEHDAVDVRDVEAGGLHRLVADLERLLDQVIGHLRELLHREQRRQRQRALGVPRDVGDRDLDAIDLGELDLRPLRVLLELLHGHPVLPEVDARLLVEGRDQVVHDPSVEVVAAEEGVACGGPDLEDIVVDVEHGDVEGAAAEVVDGDALLQAFVIAVGQRRGGGLVQNLQDLEPRDASRVLCGLALAVREVGGTGDHGLRDRLAEVVLGDPLHLLQDDGRDLRDRIDTTLGLDADVAIGAFDEPVGEKLP